MKKLSYFLFLLVSVPIVALMSETTPLIAEREFFIGKVMSDESIDELLKETVDEPSDEVSDDEAVAELTTNISSKRQEILDWKKGLSSDEKQIFKKIMKNRKRRKREGKEVTKLTLEEAKKLLRRAKKRQQQIQEQNKQIQEENSNSVG